MARSNNKIKNVFDLVSQTALKYKSRAFLVGGPVRDFLLNSRYQSKMDLDIAVENKYEKIGRDLSKWLDAKVISYPQFMTMTLQLKDGSHIDIAQTRKEYYPQPGALPKVSVASIEEDLKRRDFTINAMAIEITKKPPHPIIDPFNGREDLQVKLIRILHPISFIDDPTRIFRALRFATRLGFKIETNTKMLMKKVIKSNLLCLLSGERVLYEIKMIMMERKSLQIIKSLQDFGIINKIFCVKLSNSPRTYPYRDRIYHQNWSKDINSLEHRCGGTFFLEHRKLTNTYSKLIHFFSYIPESFWTKYPLFKETMESARAIKKFSAHRTKLIKANKPSKIYQILKPIPNSALEILSLLEKRPITDKIKSYLTKYSKNKIFTTGETLKALKIPPGPKYSKIMNEILYQKLDGNIKNKIDEIKYIKKNIINV